ncbi:MAG: helix-turn-helix domain-containing protein [Flavisolibacter sp.]
MEERYKQEFIALGERLQYWRKKRNLTQLDLEVATGIGQGEISKIENGTKNIEFITIVKFAIALDIQICDLFARP